MTQPSDIDHRFAYHPPLTKETVEAHERIRAVLGSVAGDLTGTLTSPAGKVAVLFQRSGGNSENLCQVVFDDAAARPFASVFASSAWIESSAL